MNRLFIGIDLAWQSSRNPTGFAVLRGDHHHVVLDDLAPPLTSLNAVKQRIAQAEADSIVIAVDAPLVVRNRTGIRDCERQVGKRYGDRSASCHASNLTLYPSPAGVELASWLQARGYSHSVKRVPEFAMLEVYPHAAFVALFDLPNIVRYKKGRVSERCTGLRTVQEILRGLSNEPAPLLMTPRLSEFLSIDPAVLRGVSRKSYEDSLDAVFCAYVAYFVWRWGFDFSDVFGTVEAGYIVNPKLRPRGREQPLSNPAA